MGRPVNPDLHLMKCPDCRKKTAHQRVGMKACKSHLMPRARFQCRECKTTHYAK